MFPQDHNRFTEPYEANFARAFVSASMVHGTVITQKNGSITRETYQGGIDLPSIRVFHLAFQNLDLGLSKIPKI